MRKNEIKKATDPELICDAISTYGKLVGNMQCVDRGIRRYTDHCNDLFDEMLKRGLLTQSQVDYLNA